MSDVVLLQFSKIYSDPCLAELQTYATKNCFIKRNRPNLSNATVFFSVVLKAWETWSCFSSVQCLHVGVHVILIILRSVQAANQHSLVLTFHPMPALIPVTEREVSLPPSLYKTDAFYKPVYLLTFLVL